MNRPNDFWVIGVGASAGGLEALSAFFKTLPEKPHAAFIVAQHLAPHSKSMMVELLSRQTSMPVISVKDHLEIKPGLICIVPPNFDVTTQDGELRLTKAGNETRPKPSVDTFFHSLAKIYGRRAVGIILSGTGSDGSEGVRAVKENGGVVIVQDSESAKYDGMPKSAFETGMVDAVLPPEKIALQLFSILESRMQTQAPEPMDEADNIDFRKILKYLKQEIGADFSQYKISTIQRRIEKRISALHLESLKDYYSYIKTHPSELGALSQNMLVSVTSFFRDSDAWDALSKNLQEIIGQKSQGSDLRLWSAGCATGEEPYSLAILISEICRQTNKSLQVKIFATDLDSEALAYGRIGIYSQEEVKGLNPDYLNKYFEKKENHFEIRKPIKEMIVFARQDLVQNPPFVKLDMISCRNVLIYFENELQSRIFDIFHYALKPSGLLFLGKSESVNPSLFDTIDRKEKLFRKLNVVTNLSSNSSTRYTMSPASISGPHKRKAILGHNISEAAPNQLLKMLHLCGMVVDDEGVILHMMGDVSEFIQFSSGQPDFRLQNLLPKSANIEFTIVLKKCSKERKLVKSRVFKQDNVAKKPFSFSIKPLEDVDPIKPLYLVSFEFKEDQPALEPLPPQPVHMEEHYPARMAELEQEVAATRENLQTVIEELEISNEELQSLNEELSSTNEELQASNEELETTNEELQSTNEELMTLNEELNIKSAELKVAYASLENIQSSIAAPMLVVDEDLKLLRYNSSANLIFTLTPGDVGQAITKASCQCEIPDFERNLHQTMNTGKVTEVFCNTNKHIFQMRIHPNRDDNKRIIGAIIVFFDNTEFIQTQDKLKASDKRIRAIIDNSPSLISLKDNGGRYLVANRAFCKFFDIEEDYIQGKTDREIFSEALANELRDNDLEVLLKRNPTEKQEYITFKNKDFILLANRFPLTIVNERIPYAVGTVALDISAQVKGQEDLKKSEQRYRAIIEDQAVFVCRHLPTGKFTFTNTVFCGTFGGTMESNQNRDFYSIVHKSDLKKVQTELSQITPTHPITQYEHRAYGINAHSERWIRWIHRGIFDDQNNLMEYQAVGFDVTEIHNQTAALLAKESLYSHVLEHTSDYLSVYRYDDKKFYLEMFNQSANRGRSQGHLSLIGKQLADLVDPRSIDEIEEKFHKALNTDSILSMDEGIEGPSGTLYLTTTIVPIFDREQNLKRIVTISRDVTKLKRIEKALREEMKNAESANKAKSDFLASMSHELRTPLNVIMGMGQLLGRAGLKPEQGKLVESIQRSSKVLLSLIEDVLDLSKIEAGKINFESRPFNMDQVSQDVLTSFEGQSSLKGIELKKIVKLDPGLTVLGDEVRLKQILNNLISNALKFTDRGSVTVKITQENKSKELTSLYFEVKDTGIGIPEESHHKIFQRFTQADSGITRRFGGTGLGLSISKQLVELMHGQIGFKSQAGAGSTFWFRLDLPLANSLESSHSIQGINIDFKSIKVLAVDDNPEALKVLKFLFEEKGARLDVVESGVEALRAVEKETYDLILMDMQMPGMDGLETTQRIRSLTNHKKRTPVIALTANAMAGDKERCLNAGMNDYLTKPVQFDDLMKVMQKWI